MSREHVSIVAGMAKGKKAAPEPEEEAPPPTIEGIFRSYTVVLDDDKDKVSKDARDTLLEVASGSLTPRERGQFRVITSAELAAVIKEKGVGL